MSFNTSQEWIDERESRARLDRIEKAGHEFERDILQAKWELEQIIDLIPAIVAFKDQDNRFIRANKFMADLCGMTPKELIGVRTEDLATEEESVKFLEDDREVLRTGKPKLGIIEKWTTPKGPKWVRTDKVPYRDGADEVIGILLFSVDITEDIALRQQITHEHKTCHDHLASVHEWAKERGIDMTDFPKKGS